MMDQVKVSPIIVLVAVTPPVADQQNYYFLIINANRVKPTRLMATDMTGCKWCRGFKKKTYVDQD